MEVSSERSFAFLALAAVVLGGSSMANAYGVTPTPQPLPESSITSTLVYMGGEPGNQMYRYEFKIRNIAGL